MFWHKPAEPQEPYTAVYLTYSFDMDRKGMRRSHPKAKYLGTTLLQGYRLAFRGRSGYYATATIEESADVSDSVPVVLWHIPAAYEAGLEKNCRDFYRKTDISVTLEGNSIQCIAYIIDERHPYGLPRRDYVEQLFKKYRSLKFYTYPILQAYENSVRMCQSSPDEQ